MKMCVFFLAALLAAFWLVVPFQATAQFDSIFKRFKKVVPEDELSENEIIQGLKEALEIGTRNAVNKASQVDGFFKNPDIRIPLPGQIQKLEKFLSAAGLGSQIEAFELSMNRAAEKAAREATQLFWEAITQMSFSDAKNILAGRDNEATLYFKEKTSEKLQEAFKPIVHETMSAVGVTRSYQNLEAALKNVPFVSNEDLNLDLDQFVTDHTLDGIFFLLSEEERKIRQDPSARVTELLKKVFTDK